MLSAHQRRGSLLFPKDTYCHRLGPGDQGEVGGLCGTGLNTSRMHSDFGGRMPWCCVQNPHLSSASLQIASQGGLCSCPSQRKLFLHSPSLDTGLLSSLGPPGLLFKRHSLPFTRVASLQCQQLLLTPISGSFLPLSASLGSACTPTRQGIWGGDGHTSAL